MTKLKMPVDASHIMMFARAIGETNPVYFDADYAADSEAGGIIAPPTFLQACAQFDPDYHLRPKPGEPWFGSGKTPSGIKGPPPSSGGLHAEQHFTYHRHPKAGETLAFEVKTGREWQKQSKRAGMLNFRERLIEFVDEAGEKVVTIRLVAAFTERPVDASES